MPKKTTLAELKKRAKSIHGNKYNYSQIEEEHIQNTKSKLLIICNTCNFEFPQSIDNHIYGKQGCPKCGKKRSADKRRITLAQFLQKAKEIHGEDIFDYSQVEEKHIKGEESRVPIICNVCGHEFSPSIIVHIKRKCSCPKCFRNRSADKRRIKLSEFKERAKEIHGEDRYDYSLIEKEHIQNTQSKVPIICKLCGNNFSQSISKHLSGQGCKECGIKRNADKQKITLAEFLEKAKSVHGKNAYNYSLVKEKNIKNAHSKVLIICNTCNNKFPQIISDHIYGKKGCKECGYARGADKRRIKLSELLERAKDIHGKDAYDYSQVEEEHVQNAHSNVLIICNTCGYEFTQSIGNHIRGAGCFKCAVKLKADNRRTTLEQFLEKAEEIHGNKFDYSKVTDIHFQKNNRTKIPIICKSCGNEFSQSIVQHMRGSGCSKCPLGKNERLIGKILGDLKIEYKHQYCIKHNSKRIIIDYYLPSFNLFVEYNGKQHYQPVCFGGQTKEQAKKALKIQKERDELLRKYCNKNHTPTLLEIDGRKYYNNDLEEYIREYFTQKLVA